jgi:nucleoid-associated protein YgaU
VYCEVHGGDVCAECLSPASSLPSFNLYRGSLLALLVGTAIALWLLVRPPGTGDSDEVVITEFTPTPIVTEVLITPPPPTPSPTMGTPAATDTPTPMVTATPELREYIVQEGDTLIGIAELFAPPGVDPFEYATRIVAASESLSSADDPLSVGQVLVLP